VDASLPPGTVIRDEDGEIVRRISITPIPLDRTPFPLPSDATFRIFFTIQPGGAYIYTLGPIRGGWLVYPNTTGFPIGTRVQFFNYDPEDKGWHVYGMGVVTPTQVVPEPRTRLYAFTGASFNSGPPPPAGGSGPDPTLKGADPVDPSTGAYLMEKSDLYLPDVMPLALTRVYNSQDIFARQFGTGMTQAYGLFQWAENANFEDGYVILPDGRRIYYVRISDPALPWQQTVFECQTSPTRFYKSRITFNGNAFEARLTDGTVYTFGHGAPLQSIRDRYGNETRFTYAQTNAFGAGYGDLLRVTSPNGRWIEFTYYAGTTRVYQAKDNIGRTVTYTYEPSGRLSTVTDPENNVTTYTWNAANRLETIKDGRNIVYLTNQYDDATGRVLTQTLADPNATYTFAYTIDGGGNITRTDLTNPRGYTTRFLFNPEHHLTEQVEAVGEDEERRTTFDREPGSNLLSAMVDGLQRRTEYDYDGSGHLLTLRQLANTPEPVETHYTYEPQFFQLATVTDPLEHTWTIGYDSAGHVTSATDPLTHQTTLETNIQGLITSLTDPLQHTWQFGYSGGDQTSIQNPLGVVWGSFVDGAGRVLSTTDPLGRVTRLVPDKLNRVHTVTDPLGGLTAFDYDPNGRVLSLTDALTHATSYTYDSSDRLATRTDPLQAVASYGYDRNDNLTQMTDRKGQVTGYEYDPPDRLERVTYADASTVEYVYDAGDRLREIIDSTVGPTPITREYDPRDRLTSETTPEGTISYTYDLDGRRDTMTVEGQPTVTYGYDDAHHLTSITQGTSVVSMTYDNADRRETLTLPNGIVTTSEYDNANQLTGLTYTLGETTLGTLTYAYDDVGNRTSVGGTWARTGLPQAVASATYDAANRIATWAVTDFSYDANGNLASDGLTTYLWNARNQLTGLAGGQAASFGYDGLGRRRTKTVGGAATSFLYDGVNTVQELAGGVPAANFLAGGIDEVFVRTDGAGARGFLTDALGSTPALTDDAGVVQRAYTYVPFGATTASGAASANATQFTGRENDGTGLYFYRARFYSPQWQRFVSEDPIEFAGGAVNLNVYARNSPVLRTDALGLFTVSGCFKVSGGGFGFGIGGGVCINAGYSRKEGITASLTRTFGGGGFAGFAGAAGATFGGSNAPSVTNLTGPSVSFGAGGGVGPVVGASVWASNPKIYGGEIFGGAGLNLFPTIPPVPFAAEAFVNYTKAIVVYTPRGGIVWPQP
jgi:RHS repeat-associated protein